LISVLKIQARNSWAKSDVLYHSDSKSPISFTNSKMVKFEKIFFLCFR
jgi:hypothetical protein